MNRFRAIAGLTGLLVFSAAAAYAQVPEPQPVDLPYGGNRTWTWVAAQLHILFAAFILGAPIFVVICEWIGMRSKDLRYERLAKEVTKVTAILYSMTALTGALFIFVLLVAYPQFTSWFVARFSPIFAFIYPGLFIAETIILYLYWYTWDEWQGRKKARHVALGVLLNIIGTTTLIVINGPTSFMNTPARAAGDADIDLKTFVFEQASVFELIYNFSWIPLNIHRFIGNVVFGGFIAGLIAAYMYMAAKSDEDRAYYDWMGFVGNLIGVGALLLLPFAGYLLAYEFFEYDASVGPYMMADQLSMFFEMQGALVGLIFLASNYYIWLSMKRIEGLETVRGTIGMPLMMILFPLVMLPALQLAPLYEGVISWSAFFGLLIATLVLPPIIAKIPPFRKWTMSPTTIIKLGFLMVILGNAIWMTPHAFVATQALATHETELPDVGFTIGAFAYSTTDLALMPTKNVAVALIVLVTIINFLIYNRAIRRGRIQWGKIDFISQYVLIFLAFSAIYTMSLMGTVRSLVRKYFHVYNVLPDFTTHSFTPTLVYSGYLWIAITLTFYAVVSFAIWVSLRPGPEKAKVPVLAQGAISESSVQAPTK
tara:strand:+ start:46 stop:1833 length:1788 start_codon:yes stop_codon:yes gene_type:complete